MKKLLPDLVITGVVAVGAMYAAAFARDSIFFL
jgi:hypothetical protein